MDNVERDELLFFSPGFIENMWDKADHVMFIHAQEYPNIATHPCK